jgi:hypothetical protein
MMNLHFKTQLILSLSAALILITNASAQNNKNEDTMLINKEKQKWEALKTGKLLMQNNWFADDFVSIGYMPDGSVYRTEKKNLAKPTNAAEKRELPPAIFMLSNFKTITVSPGVKIITYQADGLVNLYATTTWVKRNNEWKSIFYQATRIK